MLAQRAFFVFGLHCRPGQMQKDIEDVVVHLLVTLSALGDVTVKRPKKRNERFPNKPKFLDRAPAADALEAAATAARYVPSDYHCKIDGRLRRRVKPATPCPRDFSLQEAGNAIRAAMRAGRVSRQWINGFPRHLWHRIGDVWYEACTNNGTAGTYHAYPIEVFALPAGLDQ